MRAEFHRRNEISKETVIRKSRDERKWQEICGGRI